VAFKGIFDLIKNIAKYTVSVKSLTKKHVENTRADISTAVKMELFDGNDLLGNKLAWNKASTDISLVTDDNRPSERLLGRRVDIGGQTMNATGRTIDAIEVVVVGNRVEVRVNDPKARDILEMHKQAVSWRATTNQKKHMSKSHGLTMVPGKIYSRTKRQLIPDDISSMINDIRDKFGKDIERALRETI